MIADRSQTNRSVPSSDRIVAATIRSPAYDEQSGFTRNRVLLALIRLHPAAAPPAPPPLPEPPLAQPKQPRGPRSASPYLRRPLRRILLLRRLPPRRLPSPPRQRRLHLVRPPPRHRGRRQLPTSRADSESTPSAASIPDLRRTPTPSPLLPTSEHEGKLKASAAAGSTRGKRLK